MESGRRTALMTFGIGLAAAPAMLASPADAAPPVREGGGALRALLQKLHAAPARRNFKTVPMILRDPADWDDAAFRVLMQARCRPRQVWNMTEITGPWLNLLRNAINTQMFSFGNPDYLAVAACHGSAQLALFDQVVWNKYKFGTLLAGKLTANTLIEDKPFAASPDINDPHGLFGAAGNTIPALMRRGVVFAACHNAIWEISAKLMAKGLNPDGLSHGALAAELTNHLIPGAVLTPGIVGAIAQLEQAGYGYAA